ncbi:XRE family transcriptional regulator [Actinoplanes sp. TBRC 11911]|uniref:XRE family transcriptional regulator n=1 Tax=Actinoplanes sp. TBRC 11911 TaxID=2729386 RepID=UPI001B7D510C|nr:XRE family transcriptional regulator [Actinoplanes sp. TBRC 11911]
MTGWSLQELWPDLSRPADPDGQADEVRIVYPQRNVVPASAWSRLFDNAKLEISVLAYSALFLAEDLAVSTLIRDKAEAGVRVRIALGRPDGHHVADRGHEEQVGDGMSARIRTSLIRLRSVADAGGELRLHDTVLYNSIYRADDELLINTHVYGHPASHAPVIHLKQRAAHGMAATYLDSFERVWAGSCEIAC